MIIGFLQSQASCPCYIRPGASYGIAMKEVQEWSTIYRSAPVVSRCTETVILRLSVASSELRVAVLCAKLPEIRSGHNYNEC